LLEAELGLVDRAPEGADEDAAEALCLRERVPSSPSASNRKMCSPVATAAYSLPGTRDEGLDSKSFVATYFPGTRRHNFKAIIAYSGYRSALRASPQSASELDLEAPSI
jgi:hypothetical protein